MQHIIIAGGGIGGLCLAQGLLRASIPFLLLEADEGPSTRGQGYRLRIDSDGQRALKHCLPPELYALFRATASQSGLGRFVDPQLQPFGERRPDSWQPSAQVEPEDGDLSVNRQTLREILTHGLHQYIRWGHSVRDYALTEDGVRLTCQNGQAYHAAAVVAAEGVGSALRQQFLPQAQPEYIGAINLYGKTALTPAHRAQLDPVLLQGVTVVFANGFTMVIEPMRFRADMPQLAAEFAPDCTLSPVADYMYWAFTGREGRMGGPLPRTEASAEALSARMNVITRDFHPQLRAVMALGDNDSLRARAVRMARDVPQWTTQRLTLLGDAIHAMSPAGGLGANTALCDASKLVQYLNQYPVMEAFAHYERDMRARAEHALFLTRAGNERLLRVQDETVAA